MTDYERIKREYDLSLLQKNRLMDKVWPVGSIYMSINSTDPGALFGGVWERIEGRFLLGASSKYAAGTIGGEADHQLTVAEMPSHVHGYNLHYGGVGTSRDDISNGKIAGATYGASTGGRVYYDNMHGAGGDKAHNNMPPYLAVYIWVRIR